MSSSPWRAHDYAGPSRPAHPCPLPESIMRVIETEHTRLASEIPCTDTYDPFASDQTHPRSGGKPQDDDIRHRKAGE